MRTRTIISLAAVPALCTLPFLHLGTRALWIPYWPCPPRTVHETSSCSFAGPECPEIEDVSALNDALFRGDPPPPGFSITGHTKREIARTTGAVDWFGRHEIALSITDGMERLRSARLYLDDELVDEATWENGKLADRAVEAEASLRLFLPWIPYFKVRLVTEDWNGRTEESSFSIGHAPSKSK
jgi:hypothetical protein